MRTLAPSTRAVHCLLHSVDEKTSPSCSPVSLKFDFAGEKTLRRVVQDVRLFREFCLRELEGVRPIEEDVHRDPTTLYEETEGTPEEWHISRVVKLCRDVMRARIRDADFWRLVSIFVLQRRHLMEPIHIACVLNYIKQMKLRDPQVFVCSQETILNSLGLFQLQELSILLLTYAAVGVHDASFFCSLGDRLVTIAQEEALKQDPGTALRSPSASSSQNISLRTRGGRFVSREEQAALREEETAFVSWVHAVGAFAKVGMPHQEVFEAAVPPLVRGLENLNMQVSGKFLCKTVVAYARFGFRHERLLDAAVNRIPAVFLPDDSLLALSEAFFFLKKEVPVLTNICKLRLETSYKPP